ATYGEEDSQAATRNGQQDSLRALNMEPETDVIRVRDGLFIYATLAVDDRPAVQTRALEPDARIRIAIYDSSTITNTFTKLQDIVYRDSDNFLVRNDGSGFKIQLADGFYKLVAYSYNTTAIPIQADVPMPNNLNNVNSSNDLIWGESPTVQISGNAPVTIPITMYHKMSQVRLVAKMRDGSPGIYGLSTTVDLSPGYTANLATFTGAMSKNSASPTQFTFPAVTVPVDSVVSNTRTVYTNGEIPTVIHIGTLTIGSGGTPDTTITNIPATFAKSLRSGYSYTMTMNIGESPEITDDEPPQGFVPYVGAFWRASQTGERLIRMKVTTGEADSVWTARIIEGSDWITLDTNLSSDFNVWTPSAAIDTNAAFGSSYPVPAGNDFVSGFATLNPGQDEIYFRIGLNSAYTPTPAAPARYGVVLLTYGNNRYRNRIWIRQGEGDDFVMRNGAPPLGDALTGGNRTLSVQFSPYNLTANALPEYVSTPTSTQVAVNGGNFVQFPTQGGALWYWATDSDYQLNYLRRAYHGSNPLDFSTVALPNGWLNDALDLGYQLWDDVMQSPYPSETCPPGYRRPADGATNAFVSSPAVNSSEIRQSLWLNPPTGQNDNTDNSVWGYYADGYFDRYGIETTLSGGGAVAHDFAPQTAVTPLTKNAAYMGRLVYNPNNLASLFFPAAGHRGNNVGGNIGELAGAGNGGFYWTSTANNAINHYWSLVFVAGGYDGFSELGQREFLADNTAFSIRCVKAEETRLPPEDIGDIARSQYHWVGAFWKNNQRAERLIRWSNPTNVLWTATVTQGADFIRLDTKMTDDPFVGWRAGVTDLQEQANVKNGNDEAGFDNLAIYQVPTTAGTTVSGTGPIYFRIGLTGDNPTSTPRYGVVHLSHGAGATLQEHDIFVRQGENPDLLYAGRANAVAFSPYNLTAFNNNWPLGGGFGINNHPDVGTTKGSFVQYPSQGGAHFVWSITRAFHPTNPSSGGIENPGNWYQNPGQINGVSATWATSMDVCPQGYRFPVDDAGGASTSEMRQSLYNSPQSGNTFSTSGFTFGYYADGFFDRREIKSSPGGGSLYSAVSTGPGSVDVAYLGVLFYNPSTYKSLFFPAAGGRIGTAGGGLSGNGAQGNYRSSTSGTGADNIYSWVMFTNGNNATTAAQTQQFQHTKRDAESVRCVRIP
ncbi:MAG: fibrobacter succinogenes major paralogous domain-containing protein, partial [Tannerella sp.]|nr:fibrobacter succinogenes major paralogous domain-containing protein [Tannerella sp.]